VPERKSFLPISFTFPFPKFPQHGAIVWLGLQRSSCSRPLYIYRPKRPRARSVNLPPSGRASSEILLFCTLLPLVPRRAAFLRSRSSASFFLPFQFVVFFSLSSLSPFYDCIVRRCASSLRDVPQRYLMDSTGLFFRGIGPLFDET